MTISCPLCGTAGAAPLGVLAGRAYAVCTRCGLAFMLRAHLPSREAELEVYTLHENDVQDPRYRAFLDRLALPLLERLAAGARGLDYGAGPGPALVAMLRERGHEMALFDPFFAPDRRVLGERYDFVTCTETAEHFHDPAAEFTLLAGLLAPGGWLGVMTQVIPHDRQFLDWHYVRDPTHVCFYADRTFEWIAAHLGWRLERPAPSVALFNRPVGLTEPRADS